jgi:hypothetical protein
VFASRREEADGGKGEIIDADRTAMFHYLLVEELLSLSSPCISAQRQVRFVPIEVSCIVVYSRLPEDALLLLLLCQY